MVSKSQNDITANTPIKTKTFIMYQKLVLRGENVMIKHHEKVACALEILFYLTANYEIKKITVNMISNHLSKNSYSHENFNSSKSILNSIKQCNDTFPNLIEIKKANKSCYHWNSSNFYYVSLNRNVYTRLLNYILDNTTNNNFCSNPNLKNDNLLLTIQIIKIILDEKYKDGISFIELYNITKCSYKQIDKIIISLENLFANDILISNKKPNNVTYKSHHSCWIKVQNRNSIIEKISII